MIEWSHAFNKIRCRQAKKNQLKEKQKQMYKKAWQIRSRNGFHFWSNQIDRYFLGKTMCVFFSFTSKTSIEDKMNTCISFEEPHTMGNMAKMSKYQRLHSLSRTKLQDNGAYKSLRLIRFDEFIFSQFATKNKKTCTLICNA